MQQNNASLHNITWDSKMKTSNNYNEEKIPYKDMHRSNWQLWNTDTSRFDELYLFHDPCMVYFPVLALASPIQQKGLNVSDQGQRQEMEAS